MKTVVFSKSVSDKRNNISGFGHCTLHELSHGPNKARNT